MVHYFKQKQSTIYNKQSISSGFTLIELLVVIVIISILATLLMANFVGVRQRGRDGQRKSDLRQIQAALELYRADNGSYPPNASLSTCGTSFSSGTTVYMQKIPCDPSLSTDYFYTPSEDGTTYSITACLENGNDSERESVKVGQCSTASYTLNNP